jgi:uncharacterized repeat protein (TIGR01451 family)
LINGGEHDHTIQENIISNSSGTGILVEKDATGIKITKNSIYSNGGVGIDLSFGQGTYLNEGLTANNGLVDDVNVDVNLSETYGNNGIDYPVITYSTLVGGKLTVKGFVGKDLSSGIFANANLEFFIADNSPNDQNGEVIINDGKNKPHGEGRTYIGSCYTNINSQFNCEFTNAATAALTDAMNITATAIDAGGNTSEFSAVPSAKANLLLVKRITSVKSAVTGLTTTFNTFTDDTSTIDDNNVAWTAGYLKGVINSKFSPGDEVEYTIYYLNSGENRITQARVCDRLNADLIFQPKFSTASGSTQGIQLVRGSVTSYLTNTDTDTDGGFLSSSSALPSGCSTTSNSTTNLSDNVVIVDVATSTNPLTAAVRGSVRFKVKIRQ